ncbi:MAG: electron transfer flavoprotein subunit alpha/FixB family protein [Aromatoleum sp.]|jgi:electron transfer flavoprotein alpha subunit|uniref:electron transfer flavoprotein subunit alpha/FixB family protein n=1 Tax=Aromatoleum sp. TaxID=2307007 RepID=UPI002894D3EA|nr:electron transfer flavoprotein subunit alpha/FixB family protein [Aromatoleum sp.]MDT3671835.1 electron transfer flavoprotein subunit alpha/FixB family protein [Aromatoleum sp.]
MSDAPDTARQIKKPKRALDPKYANYRGVWVYVEHEHGYVHPVSWELLGKGRQLADKLQVPLAGIVLGGTDAGIRALCDEAARHGADLCYLVQDDVLHDYRNQAYTKGMADLVERFQPEVLLLGATTQGRDLAGSLASTLLTGLTADCTGLDIDASDRTLLSSRPTFGGSLMCTIVNMATRPQMATVRPRVMPMPQRDPARTGEVIEHALGLSEAEVVTKVVDFIPDAQADKPQLAFADFIVAGGRGMAKPENFGLLFDLAKELGAEVGASRPAAHAKWVEADRQVGQSGKTVRPKLYIAAGISGAVQHRVGMEGADIIVAINNDEKAPILDFSNYALIGNAMELLPALTEAFRERIAAAKAKRGVVA